MDDHQSGDFTERMAGLRARYLEALSPTRDCLARYCAAARAGHLSLDARNEIGTIAHKLTGNGATYGFRSISEHAAALKTLRAGTLIDDEDLIARLSALIAACDDARAHGPVFETVVAPTTHAISAPTLDLPLVLIVDDDPAARDALAAIAGDLANVATAPDAETALAKMRSNRPDLVLLDDRMPGEVSGMRLQEIMRDDSALCFIPVIFISASDDTAAIVRSLTGGAVDYVIKPFSADSVREKIRKHLKKIGTDILIVEDDISVASLLEQRFLDNGFAPRIAGRVDDGFAALQRQSPDLIVLDRNLPDGDGADLLERLRDLPGLGRTPVIFLTARDSDADIRSGYARGADDYIIKPFNPDDVVNRCARLLGAAARRAA